MDARPYTERKGDVALPQANQKLSRGGGGGVDVGREDPD